MASKWPYLNFWVNYPHNTVVIPNKQNAWCYTFIWVAVWTLHMILPHISEKTNLSLISHHINQKWYKSTFRSDIFSSQMNTLSQMRQRPVVIRSSWLLSNVVCFTIQALCAGTLSAAPAVLGFIKPTQCATATKWRLGITDFYTKPIRFPPSPY